MSDSGGTEAQSGSHVNTVPPLAALDLMPAREAGVAAFPRIDGNTSGWPLLPAVVRRALSLAASGHFLANPVEALPDTPDDELMLRWVQALCLLPGITAEGMFDVAPAAEDTPAPAQALALRRALLPFLYSTLALSHEYGWPVIRSLSALEPQFPSLREIDDVFLLGDSLLVAPVVSPGATTREFPLPHGAWVNWWTQRSLEGGRRVKVDAPLEQLPLFMRAGAIVPLLPETAPLGATPVLRVFPGERETVLYQDAGQGTSEPQADYRFVYLTCNHDGEFFSLSRRVAGSFHPADDRLMVEVIGLDAEPTDVRVDRRGAPLWFYDRGQLKIPLTDDFSRLEIVL